MKWTFAVAVTITTITSICNTHFHYGLSNYFKDALSAFTGEGIVPSFEPEGWSDVKLLIYMTTHLPPEHVAFLPCWKYAIQRLSLFKYADLMLYTSTEPKKEHLKLLPFRNTTIQIYSNPGYQSGAVQAMVDPFVQNVSWFDNYD